MKKIFRFLNILFLLTISGYISAGDWFLYRSNQQLHGSANQTIPTKVKLKWTFPTDSEIVASPVISQGKILIGSTNGIMYCLDLNGNLIWEYKSDNSIEAPALILKNKVYFGNLKGTFYALDIKTGEKLWTYKSRNQINASANFWKDGIKTYILFGDYDYYLNCLDSETGELIWQYEAMNFLHSAVAIEENYAVFGGCDGFLHVIDIKTGQAISNIELATYIASSPALERGHAFIGDYDGKFTCVNYLKQEIRWQFSDTEKDLAIIGSPAIQGIRVFFGSRDKHVYCLNKFTGKLLWKKNTGSRIDASVVTDRRNILVSNMRGDVILMSIITGNTVWTFEAGSPINGNPAIADNKIFFGTTDGTIYCLTAN